MSAGLADVFLAIPSGPKSQGLAAGLTLCALHYMFIALQHAFVCCMPSLGVSSLDLGPFFERPSFLCGECPASQDDDGDPDHGRGKQDARRCRRARD